MADIDIHRSHDLGLQAARGVADKVAESLGRKFDLRGEWNGNVLHFQRTGVSGTLAISEKDLNLSVTLGFLLKALKGSLVGAIEGQLDQLLAEAKAAGSRAKAPAPAKKAPGHRKNGG